MFSRLTEKQIEEKAQFIGNFIKAKNAADGSAVDANSNVTQKSMATMEAELYKDYTIQVNRKLVHDKIEELYDKETADQYINDLNNHLIYTHDESSTKPYTYSPDEIVQAVYNDKNYLISFKNLYELCKEEEYEAEKDMVWCKNPLNMYVVDKSGLTHVTRLTRKVNTRQMVRVVTSDGHDIIVTDNHPMIVNSAKGTVEAGKCLGEKQYTSINSLKFGSKEFIIHESKVEDGFFDFTDESLKHAMENDFFTSDKPLEMSAGFRTNDREEANMFAYRARLLGYKVKQEFLEHTDEYGVVVYREDVPYNGETKVVSVSIPNEIYDYIYDITTESHTFIANGLYVHNCASISLYPFLLEGTKCLGGVSKAPKNLQSFNGSFVNFVYQVASDFAGACESYDQPLIFKNKAGWTHAKPIGEVVSSFPLDNKFISHGEEWEYSDVTGLSVYENGKYVNVPRVYRRKYDDNIYYIKTKTGKEVKCSKDHKFKVIYKGREIEVRAEDLVVGDTVVNTMNNFTIDTECDEFLKGQLIGAIAGDGTITNEYYCRLSYGASKTGMTEFLYKAFTTLYNKEGTQGNGHDCLDYLVSGKEIVKDIRSYFVGDNYDSYHKHIDVTKYTLEFLVGFVDGLMATDGCYSSSLCLSLANKELVNNVKDILSMININIDHIGETPAHDNKSAMFTLYAPVRTKRFLPLTCTRRSNNKKFVNATAKDVLYVGKSALVTSRPSKNSLYDYNSQVKVSSDYDTDVIIEITTRKNEYKYVYEIETESHWYSAGGILTHNCATVEYLHMFDWFARNQYGENYLDTHKKEIAQEFQGTVYALNQPASARGRMLPLSI